MLVQQGCRFDYCRILINGTINIYVIVKAAVRKMNRSAVESEHLCFSCTLVRKIGRVWGSANVGMLGTLDFLEGSGGLGGGS